MIEKKVLTCITCPIGCKLEVILTEDEVKEVTGNKCKRGVDYAKSECLYPVRTLTTTVRVKNGQFDMLPVKSEQPLHKDILTKCMSVINNVCVEAPIKVGDIIVKDIMSTGINIVSTKNIFIKRENN